MLSSTAVLLDTYALEAAGAAAPLPLKCVKEVIPKQLRRNGCHKILLSKVLGMFCTEPVALLLISTDSSCNAECVGEHDVARLGGFMAKWVDFSPTEVPDDQWDGHPAIPTPLKGIIK